MRCRALPTGGGVDAEKAVMFEAMARCVRESTGASLRVPFVCSATTWAAFKHHLYAPDPVAIHLLHSTWSSSPDLKRLGSENKCLLFWRGCHEMSNAEFRAGLQDSLANVGSSVAACMRKGTGAASEVLEVEVFLCLQLCFEQGSGGEALSWGRIEECLRPDAGYELQVLKVMTTARTTARTITGLPSSYLFVKFKISAGNVLPAGGVGPPVEAGLPRGDSVTPPTRPNPPPSVRGG